MYGTVGQARSELQEAVVVAVAEQPWPPDRRPRLCSANNGLAQTKSGGPGCAWPVATSGLQAGGTAVNKSQQ